MRGGSRRSARSRTAAIAKRGKRFPSAVSLSRGEEVGGRSPPGTITGRLSTTIPAANAPASEGGPPARLRSNRISTTSSSGGSQTAPPPRRLQSAPRSHSREAPAPSRGRPARGRERRHARDRDQERGRGHLLDSAPEVVAVEQRRLRARKAARARSRADRTSGSVTYQALGPAAPPGRPCRAG